MRWHRKPYVDQIKWHSWFAWHPVTIDGTNTRVWLETVERRIEYNYAGEDHFYRLPINSS